MRIFIYLTILSFSLISCSKQKAAKPTGEPITLSVNYSEGDSKIITAEMDMEMEMKIGDQSIPIQSSSTFEYSMMVEKDLGEEGYLTKFKYERIKSKSGGPVQMTYDSNEPSTADSLLGVQLSPLIGPEISMKISTNGNTSILGGTEELPDMIKLQIQETIKSLSSLSGFPDYPVDNGDSWEETIVQQQGGVEVTVDTTYTLLDMTDGVATINVEGKMTGAMEGEVEGETKIDIVSGWLIEANSSAEAKSKENAGVATMKISTRMSVIDS